MAMQCGERRDPAEEAGPSTWYPTLHQPEAPKRPLHSHMACVFFKVATLAVSPFCSAAVGLSIPSSVEMGHQE